MSNYSSLKATINANIKANNNHEITGAITNSVLNAMVNSLGAGYQFMGVATPTNPGSAQTPDYKCFYLATTPGTYTNLGGLVVADGEVAILKYDTSWTKEVTGIATAAQLNQLGQKVSGINTEENHDGKFIVADENNRAAMIVDENGISSKGFHIVADNGEKQWSVKNGDAGLEIKDQSGAEQVVVGNDATHVKALGLKNENGEESVKLNGENEDFRIVDENGRAAFVVDENGAKAKEFHIVDEYGTNIKTIGENTLWRAGNQELRLLVIGDSYSQQGLWVASLRSIIPFKSVVNLGVGSASLKDKYEDRETYPYTSRPTSSVSSGNLNTFACQIEKLKRLMAGTDLDAGESQIYTEQSQYPNIIIIEGGQNDGPDSDAVVNTYFEQFVRMANNVYIQTRPNEEITQDSCLIQTPIDSINRTCFAGAYRYLIEELKTLFPNAQVFITTRSNLSYWKNNWLEPAKKIVDQQKLCADIAGVSVIDWFRDGQISTINNHISGSGTQEDPYIWAYSSDAPDTNDLLHPNASGGSKLGQVAANVIMSNIINM